MEVFVEADFDGGEVVVAAGEGEGSGRDMGIGGGEEAERSEERRVGKEC